MPRASAGYIQKRLDEGWSQADIARDLDVSRQYINSILMSSTGYESVSKAITEIMPWEIRTPHIGTTIYRMMRTHAELMLYGPDNIANYRIKRLGGFYRRLELNHTVVEYHPDIPPNKNSRSGGFTYRDREDQDADLIIRVNNFARVKGVLDYWRFPPVRP